MLKDRVDEIETTILEIEGRALMHDVLIAHLLGRIGVASGNMEGFIKAVLPQVGADLQQNAAQAVDDGAKARCAYALEAFENFAASMQQSLKSAHKTGMN